MAIFEIGLLIFGNHPGWLFSKMTHSTRSQVGPSLSVRTRASVHKTHTQMVNRHGFPWKRIQMRLRNRTASTETSNTDLSDYPAELPSDSLKITARDSQGMTTSILSSSSELPGMAQCDLANYPPSSSSSISSESASGSSCKWEGCGITIEPSQLIMHIQQVHVLPQFVSCRRKCFCCLWRGCRVFRQPSVSAAWLEQHILHHTDAKGKPFRCIFDSCMLRFSTSILLERHVQRCHIRTTRARIAAHTCNNTFVAGESTVAEMSNSGSTQRVANQPPESNGNSTMPSIVGKKCMKRRRKLKCYRVRRVDFYDNRSRRVIEHRLKILTLLNRLEPTNLETNPPDQLPAGLASISETPHLALPKPLRKMSPTKPRLRSSIQPGLSPQRPNLTSSETRLNDPFDHISRLRNVALLLTIPHTFIGQRLSDDRHTEFLIRWLDGTGATHLPPMWISEEHLKAARTLSEL
ncbi:Zinc finger protein AEBP2 [Fasciola gigantica]|uniref:Zinc finger protein AEBP2 n=1 Tax=Fasciola gigantica TaxID=46835 RepID=A0A504YH40_FASGI|nr:Zinc finger protein AEBP2 [Fasciola gigantica]